MSRTFLLSPAYAAGERARMIMSESAQFDLARRLRSSDRRPTIGEVFSFLSGLYFRGKLAYANAFARPYPGSPGVLVITPNRGLIDASTPISLKDLRAFAEVDIAEDANQDGHRAAVLLAEDTFDLRDRKDRHRRRRCP